MPEHNIVSEGLLVTDINPSYMGKDVVTYALNSTISSHKGDAYFRQNEESTIECYRVPYNIIGKIPIKNNRFAVFSTDGISSEIGIGNINDCTYTKLVSSDCLNFQVDKRIDGKFKENDKGEEIVTFSDNFNPVRRINLQKLPYTYTFEDDACQTKIFTDQLDCEASLLFRQIGIPQIKLDEGYGGNLENGMYSVVIAYNIDNQRYGDFYSLTLPIPIFSGENNQSGSLDVEITGLDREFDKYELVVVRNVNGVTEARRAGFYPTSVTKVRISTLSQADDVVIPLETLVVTKKVWERAGFVSGNSEYLILADLTSRPRFNIQAQIKGIEAEYVVHQYPLNYYREDGENVGYWRDENYIFFLRYWYTTGDATEHAVILGRYAEGNEKAVATGEDVYEVLEPGFEGKIERWQKFNTASRPIDLRNKFVNNTREFGYGKLGYHESTEILPDNKELFGEDACTPIRMMRMPNEEIVPRYSIIDDEYYINVLGVRFKNIPYPKDADGEPIKGIVGYEILRGDRLQGGNRTVIARGMMTNARGYTETQGQNLEVVYANYGVNDLRPDAFLSSTQTQFKSNRERRFAPLTTVYTDKFNFYTPHAYFGNKYRMGEEFVFETIESGPVNGYFEEVFNHPKDKLITNFALYTALIMGAIQGLLSTTPRVDKQIDYKYMIGGPNVAGTEIQETSIAHDEIGNSPIFSITPIASAQYNAFQIAKRVLQTLAKAGMFVYFSAEFASNALKIIKNFSQAKQYAFQYNGVVNFNLEEPILVGNKVRKAIRTPEYLSPSIHTIGNKIVNNIGRAESIFVELNKEVVPPVGDNSKQTINEFRSTPGNRVTSQGAAYYATSKIKNPSQYGTLDSITTVKTSNSPIPMSLVQDQFEEPDTFTSPTLFGGDCIIYEFAVLNKMPFFSQDIAGAGFMDGQVDYDYRMYRSVAYPRFWVDYSEYEIGNLISKSPTEGALPANKYNMDGKSESSRGTAWTVEGKYFYLYYNTVLKFIAEADYNIAFREKTEVPHYSRQSTSLSEIFKSNVIRKPEEFKLDPAFEKLQSNEFFSQHLPLDFDPFIEAHVRTRDRNGLIYSLPSFEGQRIDNWLYFLPGNYFSFSNTDFGNLTGVHKLDQDKVIFLFDKASPYILPGRDQLETVDGRKITIGDGGLFAVQPRELIHTDTAYGASQSRYAFTSTQFGAFYPSARQGRIFMFSSGLDDITRAGMSFWCKEYMPIKLIEHFPDYNIPDTPNHGVGYLSVFDSSKEIYYLTKRDLIPQPSKAADITFNKDEQKFFYRGQEIDIKDDNYFKDISWTLSYSPAKKGFISWHSWIPDMYVQTEEHFLSVKGNVVWKHNEATDSFCRFYGEDHTFELAYPINTGNQVHLLTCVELIFEAYKYRDDGRNAFHVHSDFWSHAMVYNSEQHSGLLNLHLKPNDPYIADAFGGLNFATGGYDVLYSKVENRYRFNDFVDITADRGKYAPFREYPLWLLSENGWKRIINPKAIDYRKPAEERKKFRHYLNEVWFGKDVSGSTKYLTKFVKANIKPSPR